MYKRQANLWEIEEPGPQRTFNTAKYDEIGTNPNIAFGKRDKYDPELFYEFSEKIKEKGATILGGCCETTPSHIEAITKLK